MAILVTGARGTVGGYFAELRGRFDEPLVLAGRNELDVADAQATLTYVEQGFSAVVNLAAATDVDRCEREPEWAERLNAEAAANVATAAVATGTRLVHVSTTAIFGGDEAPGPFDEEAAPHPPNVYARTKLDGERRVRAIVPDACIVRTAWVMGGGVADKKFVGKVAARLQDGAPVMAVDDQFGSPTYAHDLVVAIAKLIGAQAQGTFHVTGQGRASRYDMAVEMKRALESTSEITRVPASTFPLPAARAISDVSRSVRLGGVGIEMPTWQDGLRRYLRSFC